MYRIIVVYENFPCVKYIRFDKEIPQTHMTNYIYNS